MLWSGGDQFFPPDSQLKCYWVMQQLPGILPAFRLRWHWGPHSTGGGYMTQLSCQGGTRRAHLRELPNFPSLFGQEGPGAMVCSGWGYDSALLPGHGQPDSRAGKTLI